jgi:glycosyltransferase involved in cell wall biosynthesis
MISFSYYPEDTRIRREAEALVENGDKVDIICLRHDEEQAHDVKNNVRIFRLSTGKYRGSSSVMYLLRYTLFFMAVSLRLLALNKRENYQIIQIHTMPDFLVFAAAIPKFMGSRIILDVHDLVPELYQTKFGLKDSHWLIRLLTWVEKSSIRFADRAIAVSRPHLNALVTHGNPADKFIIFMNLPDTKFSSHRTPSNSRDDGKYRIIYHGTLSRRYGIDIVIRALAELRNKIEGLEFRIIGKGEELPLISTLIHELSLSDCVTIKEWLPLEEFIPIILDADIGVVPILDDAFTKHAMPVKLLEYVALGKPVVCSRTKAIQAYFDDTMVQYCTAGSLGELTENIYFLYKYPDKREQLIRNADRFNQEHSWEQQKQSYFRMMDELIKPTLKGKT